MFVSSSMNVPCHKDKSYYLKWVISMDKKIIKVTRALTAATLNISSRLLKAPNPSITK